MLWIQDLQIPWNQWLLVSITVHTSLTIFLTQWPFERDTSLGRIKQQVRSPWSSCISLGNPRATLTVLKSLCISLVVLKSSCISLVVLKFSCIRDDEGGSQRWMPPAINRGPSLACATYLQILHCLQWKGWPTQCCIYNTFATHFWDEDKALTAKHGNLYDVLRETSKKYVANFTPSVVHSEHFNWDIKWLFLKANLL